MTIEQFNSLIAEKKYKELIESLNQEPHNVELILTLGEHLYRIGHKIEALNLFNLVLQKEPANAKAKTYVSMINGILDFFHKDMLNP